MKISKNLNYYFRLNCGSDVGMGHFTRALSLSQIFGLKKSIFVLDKNSIQLDKFNNLKKIFLYDYGKKYVSETLDAILFVKILKNKKKSIVVVDDYRFSKKWEKIVSKYCLKIICIDDYVNRPHFSDYYINTKPDLYEKNSHQKKKLIDINKKNCKFLLGPEYFPINSNLKKIPRKEKKFSITFYNGSSGDILIYKKIINKILLNKKNNVKINIILGIYSKNNYKKKIPINFQKKINILKDQNNLNEILNNTDLLISSAGVILFEASFLEVPSILIQMNKNQYVSTKSMENLGHYLVLKKKDIKRTEKFYELITILMKNIDRVKNLMINKNIKLQNYKLSIISGLEIDE